DHELHLGVKGRFFRGWTRVAGRRADALVAPSEATRAEVVRHTGTPPEAIAVVPHGVDHDRFRPPSPAAVHDVRGWLGLRPREAYVAFLGTLEPRKNVPALIQAFVTACGALSEPPVLVLAGGRGWDEGIDPALAAVPEGLTVIRPGFVPDLLVPALLGSAEVVAYPALGEGFGLPVLEAMACGAPVLTTRRLSLPEVGGDAVAYAVTPDASDIADALARLLADPAERARLGAAGLKRASGFTWEATARGHFAVYERVCARA
ncbi:glycosyltransferase family 1 protein, partial [Lapillicoccus sp.]|uniref:glycosyltransferase family 4 protein n=1 Tax=Lapillicoccus sp. TaxID=1909287 RepID=UPI003264BD0F